MVRSIDSARCRRSSLLALDPGELGQGVDEVGLGVGPGLLVERGEDGGRVAAVAAVEGVPLERLDGPLARAVEPGEAPLDTRVGRSPRLGRDGHVGGPAEQGQGDRKGGHDHGRVTPSTREGRSRSSRRSRGVAAGIIRPGPGGSSRRRPESRSAGPVPTAQPTRDRSADGRTDGRLVAGLVDDREAAAADPGRLDERSAGATRPGPGAGRPRGSGR